MTKGNTIRKTRTPKKPRRILTGVESLTFIDVWKKFYPQLMGQRKNAHILLELQKELCAQGIDLTLKEIRTRIHNFRNMFRSEKRGIHKGSNTSEWTYFQKLDEFLGDSNNENGDESVQDSLNDDTRYAMPIKPPPPENLDNSKANIPNFESLPSRLASTFMQNSAPHFQPRMSPLRHSPFPLPDAMKLEPICSVSHPRKRKRSVEHEVLKLLKREVLLFEDFCKTKERNDIERNRLLKRNAEAQEKLLSYFMSRGRSNFN